MLVSMNEILAIAEKKQCAIPAFNVYNMEMVNAVMQAAEELHAPVIFQNYFRMYNSDLGDLLAAVILTAAKKMSVPAVLHLDHGENARQVVRALRSGATSVMIDASARPFEENVAVTRAVVEMAGDVGVPVEGELGHVGLAAEAQDDPFTRVDEAMEFVRRTGVSSLAVQVGTAHGRYKQPPKLDIRRIEELRAATGIPLVLHGGSGVPDEQLRAAIAAGVRKINIGTDLCYAYLDGLFEAPRNQPAVDLFMEGPTELAKNYAMEKIRLLGAVGAAD